MIDITGLDRLATVDGDGIGRRALQRTDEAGQWRFDDVSCAPL